MYIQSNQLVLIWLFRSTQNAAVCLHSHPVASVSGEIDKAARTDAPPSLTDEGPCFELILLFSLSTLHSPSIVLIQVDFIFPLQKSGFSIFEAYQQFEGTVKLLYDHWDWWSSGYNHLS